MDQDYMAENDLEEGVNSFVIREHNFCLSK